MNHRIQCKRHKRAIYEEAKSHIYHNLNPHQEKLYRNNIECLLNRFYYWCDSNKGSSFRKKTESPFKPKNPKNPTYIHFTHYLFDSMVLALDIVQDEQEKFSQFLDLLSRSESTLEKNSHLFKYIRHLYQNSYLPDNLCPTVKSTTAFTAMNETPINSNINFTKQHANIHDRQINRAIRKDKCALNRWLDEQTIKERYLNQQSIRENHIIFVLNRAISHLSNIELNTTLNASVSLNRLLSNKLLYRLLSYPESKIPYHTLLLLKQIILQRDNRDDEDLDQDITYSLFKLCNDPNQSVWSRAVALSIILKTNSSSALTLLLEHFSLAPSPLKKRKAEIKDNTPFLKGREIRYLSEVATTLIEASSTDKDRSIIDRIFLSAIQDKSIYVRQATVKSLVNLNINQIRQYLPQICHNNQSSLVIAQLALSFPQIINRLIHATGADKGKCNKSVQQRLNELMDILDWCYDFSLQDRLSEEEATLVKRCYCQSHPKLFEQIKNHQDLPCERYADRIIEKLTTVHQFDPNTIVRREASQTREQIWFLLQSETLTLPSSNSHIYWQRTFKIPISKKRTATEEETLGRLLSLYAQQSHGFDIELKSNRLQIIVGSLYRFRLWRFLYELTHSASDKRLNHSHVKGRVYYGLSQAPNHQLAELSKTRVPGEPLHIESEGNWRPYLPLLDQVISSLDQGWPTQPMKIYTSEGITAIYPPTSFFKRLYARTKIVLQFKRIAEFRNWDENAKYTADHYLRYLEQLGFTFKFYGHIRDSITDKPERYPVDERVRRFFPTALSLSPIPLLWDQFVKYFYSIYSNSVKELLVFLTVAVSTFFGRHIYVNHRFKSAREQIPLVIGGWGTRGKSGTERLKAALLNSMGMTLVSKTTGCEAMFLFGNSRHPLKEIPLFRPYEKASIWEQNEIVQFSQKAGCDIFLWECMGLTPRYVKILQEQWMRDDISTITNCYPDHEDIQGPAGIDIAQVMQNFIPKSSQLITTEKNMRPFLFEAAHKKSTRCTVVEDWFGALIPPEILDRFPYAEHPTNINLALELADQLGIERDIALQEMADRVIPDIGVLKRFPQAKLEGRCFRFTNGMSANERRATLDNWHRMGFNKINRIENPNVIVTALINNRSDRLARSQAFAKIVVNDITANFYLIIGTNQEGLVQYILKEWDHYISTLPNDMTLKTFEAESVKRKIPISMQQIIVRFSEIIIKLHNTITDDIQVDIKDEMNEVIQCDIGSIADKLNHLKNPTDKEAFTHLLDYFNIHPKYQKPLLSLWEQEINDLQQYQSIAMSIDTENIATKPIKTSKAENSNDNIQNALTAKAQLTEWFTRSLLKTEDLNHGIEIIHKLFYLTPPGIHNDILGLQNIKGIGLDFIRVWQRWEQIHQCCHQLMTGNKESCNMSAQQLSELCQLDHPFSGLELELLQESLPIISYRQETQTEAIQMELKIMEHKLKYENDRLPFLYKNSVKNSDKSHSNDTFIERFQKSSVYCYLKSFYSASIVVWSQLNETTEVIKRRKLANTVYRDLSEQRISAYKAIELLKTINHF